MDARGNFYAGLEDNLKPKPRDFSNLHANPPVMRPPETFAESDTKTGLETSAQVETSGAGSNVLSQETSQASGFSGWMETANQFYKDNTYAVWGGVGLIAFLLLTKPKDNKS